MVTIHQSLKRRVYNPDRLLNGIVHQNLVEDNGIEPLT